MLDSAALEFLVTLSVAFVVDERELRRDGGKFASFRPISRAFELCFEYLGLRRLEDDSIMKLLQAEGSDSKSEGDAFFPFVPPTNMVRCLLMAFDLIDEFCTWTLT